MLRDEDFSRNAPVDRYGRKLQKDDTKKHLERFYRLDEDDVRQEDEDEDIQKELHRLDKKGYDPARDGGFSSSSSDESSSEDEDDMDEDGAEEIEFPNQQQRDVPMGEVTTRIAVVNLDWDNVKAEDLMAVFSSFIPASGRILKVSVFPSEFGKERMEREDMEGPPKELFSNKGKRFAESEEDFESTEDDEEEDEEDEEEEENKIKNSMLKEDEGVEFDSTHLRKYQLERLRYFYAVLTCSSKEVAKYIYDTVDGTEYLSSANFFDLRFIPDDTDFSDDIPREECERIPDGYKPNEFVTDALQHSKVKLTWDADDSARKEAQARAFRGGKKEIDDNDLKAYLGSDSSDDEEEGGVEVVDSTTGEKTSSKQSKKEAERARVRALLGLSDKPDNKPKQSGPVGDMEVTFSAGLTSAPPRDSVFENEPVKEETTMEKYIRKERDRKAKRKARMKAAKNGETLPDVSEEKEKAPATSKDTNEEEDKGFDDPFFADPESNAAAAAKQRKEDRRKKREEREADEAAAAAKRAELELLMVDDDKSAGMNHFDMKEIEKAEKHARKSGKQKKGKKSEPEPQQDNFQMDVSDPRFQKLYESHEFAIDPTNSRFKPTHGMKAVLEEGRKRRRNKEDEGPGPEPEPGRKKQKASGKKGNGEDLDKLVERVKGKSKTAK